jgi:transposase
MSDRKTRKTYDKEFKISAVKLVLDSGRTLASIAADLGISDNSLFLWKKKYLEDAKNSFPGKGRLKPEDEELRKKDREIATLKMERDILKKAIAFFARDEK